MPKITSTVGLALIVVGLLGYFVTDGAHWTALLPAVLGVVLLILGLLAVRSESPKHYMHAAMVVALLGAAGTMSRALQVGDGGSAAIFSAITWVICVVFLIFGIRSFIEARR